MSQGWLDLSCSPCSSESLILTQNFVSMPWKATKLVFCGIPVRRRMLYVITLVSAIVCVPTLSWFLLVLDGPFTQGQQVGFAVATVIPLALALNGWRLILKHHSVLFREEARVIWPGSIALLLAATGFACVVAHQVMKRGRMDFIVPLVFGGGLFLVLLVRLFRLSSHPKRSDIVRGDSGRRRSRSHPDASSEPEESVAAEVVGEETADDESPAPPPDVPAS